MYLGEFRNRVALQTLGGSIDAGGGKSTSWSTETTVWGKVETLSGAESIFGDQLRATNSMKFTIRYYSSLNTTYRLFFRSTAFEIVSIKVIDEGKKTYQEIIATEGVAFGN